MDGQAALKAEKDRIPWHWLVKVAGINEVNKRFFRFSNAAISGLLLEEVLAILGYVVHNHLKDKWPSLPNPVTCYTMTSLGAIPARPEFKVYRIQSIECTAKTAMAAAINFWIK